MYRFFPTIIAPILEALDPKTVIEIGCADGAHTRLLLDDCNKRNAVLHAVDPEPQFDTNDLMKKNPQSFAFHQMMSIEALPALPKADVVLIDGDHNYFTVFHELTMLCADTASMPVILLHDTGWPYARRDMYADPSRLPQEYVHPHARKGLAMNHSRLREVGHGVNAGCMHAEHEGGPKNGVLTAVEDAVKTMSPMPRALLVSGFHGLGILAPQRLKESHPMLWHLFDQLEMDTPMKAHIEALERDRCIARYDYEHAVMLYKQARAELTDQSPQKTEEQ